MQNKKQIIKAILKSKKYKKQEKELWKRIVEELNKDKNIEKTPKK